jgi:hypothetical protein
MGLCAVQMMIRSGPTLLMTVNMLISAVGGVGGGWNGAEYYKTS